MPHQLIKESLLFYWDPTKPPPGEGGIVRAFYNANTGGLSTWAIDFIKDWYVARSTGHGWQTMLQDVEIDDAHPVPPTNGLRVRTEIHQIYTGGVPGGTDADWGIVLGNLQATTTTRAILTADGLARWNASPPTPLPPPLGHAPHPVELPEYIDNTLGPAYEACFMHGTIFQTLRDNTEMPIEVQNLKVGDRVRTELLWKGVVWPFQQRWRPIKKHIAGWYSKAEYANKMRVVPKDAFGKGLPFKDLHVTWGHGLLLKEMREEWKNDEYDENHVTYSDADAAVEGGLIKLLAGHCALCRKPTEEENEKANKEKERRDYYHLEVGSGQRSTQHALLSHGLTTESLLEL